jgi:CHAD domain-containing protein
MQTDQSSQKQASTVLRKLRELPRKVVRNPQPKRVHQLRTTIRRTENLIKTIGMQNGNQRKLLKKLDRLRRRAGKVRAFDVQIAALRTVKGGGIGRQKAELMRLLEKKRERQERKLLGSLDNKNLSDIRSRSEYLASAVKSQMQAAGDIRITLATLLRKFTKAARTARSLTEESLHELRLQCKSVRYSAELAGNSVQSGEVIGKLKRIQNSIGEWHDWRTLARSAHKGLGEVAGRSLASMLDGITLEKFREAVQTTTQTAGELSRMAEEQRSGETKKKPAARVQSAPIRRAAHAS